MDHLRISGNETLINDPYPKKYTRQKQRNDTLLSIVISFGK